MTNIKPHVLYFSKVLLLFFCNIFFLSLVTYAQAPSTHIAMQATLTEIRKLMWKGKIPQAQKKLAETDKKIAAEIARNSDFKYQEAYIDFYFIKGLFYLIQEEYSIAIDNFKHILPIAEKNQINPKDFTLTKIHNRLGMAYEYLSKYENALKHYESSNEYMDNVNHKIKNLNNIATIYRKLGELEKALKIHQEVLALRKRYCKDKPFEIAVSYFNIAQVLKDMKKYKEVLNTLNQFLAITKETRPNDKNNIGKGYFLKGEIFTELNKYDEALKHFQEALIYFSVDFTDKDVYKNPPLTKQNHQQNIIQTLAAKAHVFLLRSENAADKESDLLTASQLYKTATNLIDSLRFYYIADDSKIAISSDSRPIYEQAIATYYQLNKLKNNEKYIDTVNTYIEKSKAFTLRQTLHDASIKSNIDSNFLAQEKTLKKQLANFEENRLEALLDSNTDTLKRYEDSIFITQTKLRNLIQKIGETNPAYYQLKYDLNLPSINQLQTKLNNTDALLNYFLGKNHIYLLSITQQEKKIYTIKKPSNFDALLHEKFRQSLDFNFYNKSEDTARNYFTQSAFKLYKLLLHDAVEVLPTSIVNLRIIPDAALSYIPFDVLLKEETNSPYNLQDINYYVISKYNCTYNYSADLWFHNKTNKQPITGNENTKTLGAYAPIYDANDYSKDRLRKMGIAPDEFDLPHARTEVKNITNLLGGDAFIGDEANKKTFKATANSYRILHFAMHGFYNEENPLNSYLLFAKEKENREVTLSVAEIYNMPFTADLAVLSACNTGSGKVEAGEGMMSLSRAFAYAGCPSTVMSLWSLPDKSTAEIMQHFYSKLKKGNTKGKALRQAKLQYFKQHNNSMHFSYPIYWAGFSTVGNTMALMSPSINYLWFTLAGLCFFLLGILLLGFRQSEK